MPSPRSVRHNSRLAQWLLLTVIAIGGALFTTTAVYALRGARANHGKDAISLMSMDGGAPDALAIRESSGSQPHKLLPPDADGDAVWIPGDSNPAPAAPAPATPGDAKPAPAPAPGGVTPASKAPPPATFNGKPLKRVRTVRMLITAYSPDARDCGKDDGITASGKTVWQNGMKMVAADARLFPFGSIVSVPGYNSGKPVPVWDRGGKIKGNHLDLLFPTHEAAQKYGVKYLDVTIYEYAR